MLPQPLGNLQHWMADAQPDGSVLLQIRQDGSVTTIKLSPAQAKEIAKRLIDQAQWAKVQNATIGKSK